MSMRTSISRAALAALTLAGFLAAAGPADALYRGHKLCDPDIGSFDDALSADPTLGGLKGELDATWRRLASFGDPDRRARARDQRLDWLCEVKAQCGAAIAPHRTCLAEALRRRQTVNEDLLRQHD